MDVTVNLRFDQLISLIKQLPADKIAKLKAELNDDFILTKTKNEIQNFQHFLLNGPIMSDLQYKEYKQNRLSFNLWREK